jgi:hypothetical protein
MKLAFIISIVSLILISLCSVNSLSLSQTQPNNFSCKVEIIGGFPTMYPGQRAEFTTNVINGSDNQNYTWIVEGPIVKDYDDNVYNSTLFSVSQSLEDPTPMSSNDFQKPDIHFYWQLNATNFNRNVTVLVETTNGSVCKDSKIFTVQKGNDIDHQAEDFYVEQNHPMPDPFGDPNSTRILSQHAQWHVNYQSSNASYNNQGDLFFDFHKVFIAHFNAWRSDFGYSPIVQWDPNSRIPQASDIDHASRELAGIEYYPNVNQSLPEYFKKQNLNDGPTDRPVSNISGTNIPRPCEVVDAPQSPWPSVQDAIGDFEPDQELLGCALTAPFHNSVHFWVGQCIPDATGQNCTDTLGDMSSTLRSPADPIFWRFHTFINNVSMDRFFPTSFGENISAARTVDELSSQQVNDTTPPRIIYQNPFRLYPFLTELPVISEQEKDLFGITNIPAISAEFSEPVSNVKPQDFKLNGSPATQVNGTGAGPYVFIGFKSPQFGPINVTLSSGNITDNAGNKFDGTSWQYMLVDANKDNDRDGAMDGLEVNLLRTDPTNSDSDEDTILDGVDAILPCLNPLYNNRHIMTMGGDIINATGSDSDSDGVTDVEEVRIQTDPCSAESLPATNLDAPSQLAIQIQGTNDATGLNSTLTYDSASQQSTTIINGTKFNRQISDSDDLVKQIVNRSGLFNTEISYLPAPNSTEYSEFTVNATLNGRVYTVYSTSVSEDVPAGIRNLPYILAYLLGTGRVF